MNKIFNSCKLVELQLSALQREVNYLKLFELNDSDIAILDNYSAINFRYLNLSKEISNLSKLVLKDLQLSSLDKDKLKYCAVAVRNIISRFDKLYVEFRNLERNISFYSSK